MTFVNEHVPVEDIEKYSLREINRKYFKGDFSYQWTVDRDREIYLRWMSYDREEPTEGEFTFFWKGTLLTVRLKSSGEGVRGGKGSTTWLLLDMKSEEPDGNHALLAHRAEIIADLKDALRAFKDFGLGSTISDHTAYFEF